jgi:hypothetical protein
MAYISMVYISTAYMQRHVHAYGIQNCVYKIQRKFKKIIGSPMLGGPVGGRSVIAHLVTKQATIVESYTIGV